jgi:hypothetical protein
MIREALLLACLAIPIPAAIAAPDSPIQIVSHPDGALTSVAEEKNTSLSIQGKGIGKATLTCDPEKWPKELFLRIHLRGLESLTVENGKVKWSASVQSQGKHETLLNLHEDGKDDIEPDKDSPYWTEILRFEANAKPTAGLPPEGGWFKLRIPAALLTNTRGLKISWVDFYR